MLTEIRLRCKHPGEGALRAGASAAHAASGRYAELTGGPLDGLLLDITGWRADEVDTGVALATGLGQFVPGGRALYDPCPGEPRFVGPGVSCRFYHCGDTP
ncbi:hypothetical protein [Streptomyces sp. enrichment culture]|uniref:hypothetical protein n=1 Tax=Streptomyces sp. enrichment culture TaxID=1795815 RepID=UPI003F56B5C8